MSKDCISSFIIICTISASLSVIHANVKQKASIRFIEPKSLLVSVMPTPISADSEEPPAGTVKSIIPCTPLAIVKCLEFVGIYNKILPYGDRAYGKTITVINR